MIMAMPQRDDAIEEIKRLVALLEYAVMHGDEAEAERLRARQTTPMADATGRVSPQRVGTDPKPKMRRRRHEAMMPPPTTSSPR